MTTDIEHIEDENGFVVQGGLRPGWYITVNEVPTVGPFDTRDDAARLYLPAGKCEGCEHSTHPGIRYPAGDPMACEPRAGYVVVERCDTCQRFASDIEAAKALAAAWGTDAIEAACHAQVRLAWQIT